LELHLTNDQIEAMLRTASSEISASDRKTIESAKIHLKTCASCRSVFRSHEEVMGQFALLKSTSPEAPEDCPPETLWNQIATKIALEDSERYLNHAAHCEHCGLLLREAAADFTDELTPAEEKLIAGLASSTPEWQERFAAQLRGAEFPAAASPSGDRWRSFLLGFLKPAPVALAAALVLLLFLGIRTRQWKERAEAQIAQASAATQRLQQENTKQQLRISQLTAQSESAGAPDSSTERHTGGGATSFVLEPELTRGAGEMKRLKLLSAVPFVSITLRFNDLPSGLLREELLTADRQAMWSQESLASTDELRSGNLLLMVPTHVLAVGDYQIVLSRQSNGLFEKSATYTFRVTR
jgi:hypothetical protein